MSTAEPLYESGGPEVWCLFFSWIC